MTPSKEKKKKGPYSDMCRLSFLWKAEAGLRYLGNHVKKKILKGELHVVQ